MVTAAQNCECLRLRSRSCPPSSFFPREGGLGKGRELAGGSPAAGCGEAWSPAQVSGSRRRSSESSEVGHPEPCLGGSHGPSARPFSLGCLRIYLVGTHGLRSRGVLLLCITSPEGEVGQTLFGRAKLMKVDIFFLSPPFQVVTLSLPSPAAGQTLFIFY